MAKVTDMFDKEQKETLESLIEAKKAASEVFKTTSPSVEQVMGTYSRCFTYEKSVDIELSVREMLVSAEKAHAIFGSDSTEGVFAIFDLIFEEESEEE